MNISPLPESSSASLTTGRRRGSGRSSEKCARCRHMRLKCLPVERDWNKGERCQRCTKACKRCGPNLLKKEETQTESQAAETVSRSTSNSSSLPSNDSGNGGNQDCTTSDTQMNMGDSGSSSEGTSSVDRIGAGAKDFKTFSRNKLSVDKCLLKVGHLFMHLEDITQDGIMPTVGALVSSGERYAVEGGLEQVLQELEYTIPRLAKHAETASALGDNILADRIFQRLFDGLKQSLDLSIKHRCSTLSKMALFYRKIEDEPQLQRVLRILSPLSMSNFVDPAINPNKMLADSLLATSSSMSRAIAGVAPRRVGIPLPVHSPALHQSIRCENPEVFKLVLQSIVDSMKSAGEPAPIVGSSEGSFMTTSSDPNTHLDGRDAQGRTPLTLACSLGDEEKCEALIQAGAGLNAVDHDGHTILAVAAGKGLLRTVRRLRQPQEKACVNPEISRKASTPLMQAAANGYLEVVRFLLDEGANPRARRYFGKKTAAQLARENGHHDIVEVLMDWETGESSQASDNGSTPQTSQQLVSWPPPSQHQSYLIPEQTAQFFLTPQRIENFELHHSLMLDNSSQGFGATPQDGFSPDEHAMEDASMAGLESMGSWPQSLTPFDTRLPSLDSPYDVPNGSNLYQR